MGPANSYRPETAQSDPFSRWQRKHLLSLAYGYLGSLVDSEDVVQEALLRFEQSDRTAIRNTAAWLTTVVTRLSIDKLRSAQHRREVYPGEWLPEPVFDAPSPEQDMITQSRLSIALLYLMEKLEPEQRVVFVLREVFQYPYGSIAEIAGKSEAACRQLMVRARAALDRAGDAPPRHGAVAEALVSRFIRALMEGDEEEMLAILSEDAVLVGDGGGKVQSILNPVYGARHIARFFLGILRKNGMMDTRLAIVNSGVGMMTWREGQLFSVASVSIRDGRITGIYSVSNPDKLQSEIRS